MNRERERTFISMLKPSDRYWGEKAVSNLSIWGAAEIRAENWQGNKRNKCWNVWLDNVESVRLSGISEVQRQGERKLTAKRSVPLYRLSPSLRAFDSRMVKGGGR